MKGKALILLALCITLFFLAKQAVDIKESTPEQARAELLKLDGVDSAREFLTGRIRPIAMSLSSRDFKVDLAAQQNGWWWVYRPETTMADQIWAHQWVTGLTQSSLLRVLSKEEWDPIGIENAYDVKLFGSGNKTLSLRLLQLRSSPQHIYFELENGMAVKGEWKTPPTWPSSMSEIRTRRLWPFEMEAVSELTYQRGGLNRVWNLVDGKWKTDRQADMRFWQKFFKNWGQWGCNSFLENYSPSEKPAATWEIKFHSGESSLMELYEDPLHGWVTLYRGRTIAQVLNSETKVHCFPKGDF